MTGSMAGISERSYVDVVGEGNLTLRILYKMKEMFRTRVRLPINFRITAHR